jgi:hypothetical protein
MNGIKGLELNEYVDIILKTLYENVGNRTVFITSFNPDLCTMYLFAYSCSLYLIF